jgi:hypothetical protein
MKPLYYSIIILFLLSANMVFSQVSISANAALPDASAMLDVKSASKGVLLTRMSFEQRNAIANPAEGLMLYCTNCSADSTGVVSIFQGGTWKVVKLDCNVPKTPTASDPILFANRIVWTWYAVPIVLGYKWNKVNDYATATDIGNIAGFNETGLACWTSFTRFIWAYNACGSSAVPLKLTQSTIMIPLNSLPVQQTSTFLGSNYIQWKWTASTSATGYKWGTTNNYDSAADVGINRLVQENDLACGKAYTRYVWAYWACGRTAAVPLTTTTLTTVLPPIEAIHEITKDQIKWNWTASPDAIGYKWSNGIDYATAIDIGNVTTKTETALTPNTMYVKSIWAYSTCGVSTEVVLSQLLPLYIGQQYRGGIIFYLDSAKIHGLIACPYDLNHGYSAVKWGCYGLQFTTNNAIGTGQANTTAIVNGCATANIAARNCDNLVYGGYSDWYLPSIEELFQLHLHKDLLTGLSTNSSDVYWSSTDVSTTQAYALNFITNFYSSTSKNNIGNVRPIRSF